MSSPGLSATSSLYKPYWFEKGKCTPTLTKTTIASIIREPPEIAFKLYCGMQNITLKPWQHQECMNMIKHSKYLINWGRGMSKTYLFVLVAVFMALYDMKVIYLVPRVDELEQPMEYFNANCFVDNNPHKKSDKTFSIKKGMWYHVMGKPMIKISNIDDKGFNVSSGRFNVCMYDECALLMYYAKEVELFNKANGMLRAMDYPHKIWASTPLIGSHFVNMKEDLEVTAPHQYSWRNFENTADNFLTDTPEKLQQILEEKQDAIRLGILYAWETENLALPRTATGRAFKNIIESNAIMFPPYEPNYVGFDFHGWANGHIWVAFYYNNRASTQDVYIMAEGAEKYTEENTADESMNFLQTDPFFRGKILRGESGGMINDPYIKAGRKWGMQSVSINGEKKHDLEANILNYVIHIDKNLTPLFYEDITSAQWKDMNKFILNKEASGTKFRNHYLDAFMNALPPMSLGRTWIPNKRLRRAQGIVEQEAKRDREGQSVFF